MTSTTPQTATTSVVGDLGPESLLWRWAGDSRIAFLGGTIGLLQTMHPAIGRGLIEHSDFFDDPVDRVFRSLPEILGTIYDMDGLGTSERVRDAHRTIKGDDDGHGRPYHALDPDTFWWAHATFQFMVEQVVDRFDRHSLTRPEREQLYADGVAWFRRYGVSDRPVPPTRADFQRTWDHIVDNDLELNEATRFVLDTLDQPLLPAFRGRSPLPRQLHGLADTWLARRLLSRPARITAVGGLPPRLRRRLGIPWSRREQAELRLLEETVKRTWPRVPAKLRWQPRAAAGWRRATGSLP
ncbi:MAG: oxygenase MpaB family protein [Nitriliruptorales bacterium]|nr:oxygenase MpaB family protein [Nitriliruptorales bacterium]